MTSSRARDAFHEARKEEILEAAAEVLVARGSDASLQHVADEVGLTRGALYRYFPSREALMREAFARCFDASKRSLEAAFAASGSPTGALLALVEHSAQGYRSEGAREGMVLNLEAVLATARGEVDSDTPVIDRGAVDAAIDLVERAQAEGDFAGLHPAGVALLLLGTLQGVQLLIAMFGDTIDGDAATETLAEAIRRLR